ncbi:MAG TPA: 5-(carboxyamino)imidazole ribonucleotide mutase [Candidatus Brocadiia bacterium]|nr:5-(carboxyamino)imidazole ribonucleotide mutase [Candidatus Brocadiales bacterium]
MGKKIGVVMGSDSDLDTMKEALNTLKEFGLEYDVDVISCHRAPERAFQYATEAEKKGYGVIIAGAGGAAHLAGVLASLTTIPIIGVPIMTTGLSGLDSLYSMVQMPGGVPVATMAIGKAGAKNAGVLAAQIFSIADPTLRKKLVAYKKKLSDEVALKSSKIKKEPEPSPRNS